MKPDDDFLRSLLRDPRESFAVEHKAWIDPAAPEGMAKIARAAIALRNNNGGYLVVGLNDDGTPDKNAPADPVTTFHQDVVQGIVSKYSAELFEVSVHHVLERGDPFVIVAIPDGLRGPTAAKRDLLDARQKKLVREHGVYVRTLRANNIVSTDEARHSDWPRLVDICFENREADIGRFVRRHLSGAGLAALHAALGTPAPPPPPGPDDKLREAASRGRRYYENAVAGKKLPPFGTYEATMLIVGDAPAHRANQAFLNRIFAAQPKLTGWPPWVDSRGFRTEEARPIVLDGGWQALIVSIEAGWSEHVDFWRIEPGTPSLYLLRALPDDITTTPGLQPNTVLDGALPIWRIHEIISVAQAFAATLGHDPGQTRLLFRFRWSGLKGRVLSSWADRRRWFSDLRTCHQDEVVSEVSMPLDASRSAQTQLTHEALMPLYEAFEGFEVSLEAVESVARELFARSR